MQLIDAFFKTIIRQLDNGYWKNTDSTWATDRAAFNSQASADEQEKI